MGKKSFIVIGLGTFGLAVAVEMEQWGAEVMAIDIDEERVNKITDYVTAAAVVDARDEEQMKNLGLSNVDGVVVAIGEETNASIMATIIAKESGAPYVFAKAKDKMHMKILQKVGADEVVIPEKTAGIRLARNLANDQVKDFVALSDQFELLEIVPKDNWIGKTLKQLDLRKKLQVNVVAYSYQEEMNIYIDPEMELTKEMTLWIIVEHDKVSKLTR